jgi:hypothetical protein
MRNELELPTSNSTHMSHQLSIKVLITLDKV